MGTSSFGGGHVGRDTFKGQARIMEKHFINGFNVLSEVGISTDGWMWPFKERLGK